MRSRKKRHHVARVKGCHECSQRRINCDLAVPTCIKCRSKGLECSGYGTRYRFTDDLVAQGKAPGGLKKHWHWPRQIPSHSNIEHVVDTAQASEQDTSLPTSALEAQLAVLDSPRNSHQHDRDVDDTVSRLDQMPGYHDVVGESISFPQQSHFLPDLNQTTLAVSIDSLYPDRQCLFRCFSEEIASKLVVIDDDFNLWRHLVLPVALSDDLVRNAIISASICYISTRSNNRLLRPNIAYQKVIQELRQRQNLRAQDTTAKQGVLVTLLLLLATALVNSFPDFREIFNLIEIFLRVTQHDNTLIHGVLGTFLLTQIEKFRGYAAPFLSRDQGMAVFRLTTSERPSPSKGWEEFLACRKLHPELEPVFSSIYDLSAQACGIYTTRLRLGPEAGELTQKVQAFRAMLEKFPDHYLVDSHTLVSSIFIAAFESVTTEDRIYFSDVLHRQYKRLGFANVLTALKYLKVYWEGQTSRDWVDLMTRYDVWIF